MEPPHITAPRHHSRHSRSRRHQTRGQSRRQQPKRYQQISRHNLPPEADGNKENPVQAWLDGLEANRQGTVSGTARLLHRAETSNHDNSPHPSYYQPSLPAKNVTSQTRPKQDERTTEREECLPNTLPSDLAVAPEAQIDHDVDFDVDSRRRHPRSIAEDGHAERGGPRKQRDGSTWLSSSGSPHEDLRFRKKRRRKTRTDRYDVVKKESVLRHQETKKPSKVSKKKSEARHTLVSAREVMDKFSSASILNERITVGVGLIA